MKVVILRCHNPCLYPTGGQIWVHYPRIRDAFALNSWMVINTSSVREGDLPPYSMVTFVLSEVQLF